MKNSHRNEKINLCQIPAHFKTNLSKKALTAVQIYMDSVFCNLLQIDLIIILYTFSKYDLRCSVGIGKVNQLIDKYYYG